MSDGKTTTITIHHDRCDVTKWTLADWKVLADFVKFGTLQHAAALSRRGMQLVLSDRHEPTGGTLEPAGFMQPDDNCIEEMESVVSDDCEITEVIPIYRGPSQFVVRYAIGHDDQVEGHDYHISESHAGAAAFLQGLLEDVPGEPPDERRLWESPPRWRQKRRVKWKPSL